MKVEHLCCWVYSLAERLHWMNDSLGWIGGGVYCRGLVRQQMIMKAHQMPHSGLDYYDCYKSGKFCDYIVNLLVSVLNKSTRKRHKLRKAAPETIILYKITTIIRWLWCLKFQNQKRICVCVIWQLVGVQYLYCPLCTSHRWHQGVKGQNREKTVFSDVLTLVWIWTRVVRGWKSTQDMCTHHVILAFLMHYNWDLEGVIKSILSVLL